MRRLWTFIFGVAVGGVLLWGAMHYHLLHTRDGIRVIPKVNATIAKTYVDIRDFTAADWMENSDLILALTNANETELIGDAAGSALQNGLDQLLNQRQQR